MPTQTRIVRPGGDPRTVLTDEGETLEAPADWELLPPGDATLTRRVKAKGPTWTVQEKRGRKTFSRGVWAPSERIAEIRTQLEEERSTEAYAKRRTADLARRRKKQDDYVVRFEAAVVQFLNFDTSYADLATSLAKAVTEHATPVGSGTVARTERIPIEKRAESAVIAWLRHHTTAYDTMKIPRVAGKRREIRRKLAAGSRKLLAGYRDGAHVDLESCQLRLALSRIVAAKTKGAGS